MHKPKLGTYPLVLRDADIVSPKNGELLYDYNDTESTVYYINKETSEKINLFGSTIHDIQEASVENTDINVTKDNTIIGDEPIIPDIKHRKFNSFYYSIYNRL
nr:MAG TPA: hypothetical protein [Caudoviricetes sp.]